MLCICVSAQRLRKRRGRSRSVKVRSKVNIKVEPQDEVTCSTDDDERRRRTAAEVVRPKCGSADDAVLPDTTTRTGECRSVFESAVDNIVTSFGSAHETEDSRTVDNHSALRQLAIPASHASTSVISSQPPVVHHYQHPYHHHHYVDTRQAAPLYHRYYTHTAPGTQRFADDIDDILSVMENVAGIIQPNRTELLYNNY